MRSIATLILLASFSAAYARGADGPAVPPSAPPANAKASVVISPSPVDWCHSIAETPNFRIYWCPATGNVRRFAAKCERLAAASKEWWLGKESTHPWTPKCEVVVHRGVAEYVTCLGPGSEATSGCATIRLDSGHVVMRRIDLRVDAVDWISESLPHELMHVVLADRFSDSRIPQWADEGIAMLSESPAKLKLRLSDLQQSVTRGRIYSLGELIDVHSSPQPVDRAAFYGQSLAVVSVLLEWGTREQLLRFVEHCRHESPEAALRDIYGARTPTDLEREFAQLSRSDRPFALAHQTLVASSRPSKDDALAE
jgi:hypothetical protein